MDPRDVAGAQSLPELARLLRTLRRREARKRRGPELTYRELAARAGWSHAMVAAYLTGKTLPPTDRFDTLVQLLGASPAEQGALATARDRVAEGRRGGEPGDAVGGEPGGESGDAVAGEAGAAGVAGAGRGAGGAAIPRQLPADVAGFTGREPCLKELDELLPGTAGAGAIAVVTGPPGVGKTSLVVHWGHKVREQFPDGDLYADLRGFAGGEPVRPAEVLAQFLRTLGAPPEQVPAELEAAVGWYRSALARRRVLILLDNAADAEQVRPLLPGSPGCLVLVTSRNRLSGLVAREGARRLSLDVLTLEESRWLLGRMLGAERVAAEPEPATELARACSRLPLALRIAAANLIDRPGRRIAEHVAQLRADGGLSTLDLVGDEEAGVRRAFDLSYRAAPPDGQRLFRLLGLLPGPDVTVGAAAALADLAIPRAAELLDQLAGAHLVYERAPGRYARHDLLHQYAGERASQEEPAVARTAAVVRWYDWCLSSADAAAKMLYPHRLRLPVPVRTRPSTMDFPDHAMALAWLDAERPNLVAAITHAAADRGGEGDWVRDRPIAWLLADTLRSYFWMRMHVVDWSHAAATALAAAEAGGDLPAQSAAAFSLGDVNARLNRNSEAISYYTKALRIADRAGWVEGEASVLILLGSVLRSAGQLGESVDRLERALELHRRRGSRYGEAVALSCLGRAHFEAGQLADAATDHDRALAIHRELGSPLGEAVALNLLGEICLAQGRLPEAADDFTRALALGRGLGDRGNEVVALRGLAAVHRDHDRPEEAMGLAREALVLACQIGDSLAEALALDLVATIHRRLGHYREAASHHQQALDLASGTGDRYPEVEALLGLADAHRGLGEITEAARHATRASTLAAQAGYRRLKRCATELLAHLDNAVAR